MTDDDQVPDQDEELEEELEEEFVDDVDEALDELGVSERLDRIEKQLARLCEILIAPTKDKAPTPEGSHRTVLPAGNQRTAFRARMGRVARSLGLTMSEFEAKYGERDTIPEELREEHERERRARNLKLQGERYRARKRAMKG